MKVQLSSMSRSTRTIGLGLVSLVLILLTITLAGKLSGIVYATRGAGEQTLVALPSLEKQDLFFTSASLPALLAASSGPSADQANAVSQVATFGESPSSASVGALTLSPDGQRVAVQTFRGPLPIVWILDLRDRARPSLTRLTREGYGTFLGWHPDGQRALYKALDQDVADPGLWIVDVRNGTHQRLALPKLAAPEGILAAAISPDGRTLAYALTQGLGTGSQIWLANLDGSNRRQVQAYPSGVVGSLVWSPDGRRFAFTTLFDSPVPFAEAGLWVTGAEGQTAQMLTIMDGGHGQNPLWSRDGQMLFFVARENFDDPLANRDPAALVSSIRAIDVTTRQESVLVPAGRARQIDLSQSASGDLLFASNRGGTLEIWSVTPAGRLRQVTAHGPAKRHPLSIPSIP